MTRIAVLLLVVAASGGCAALTNPVADGVPVRRLPVEVLGRPKSDLRPIPLTLLRQKEPEPYLLDKGDVLAIIADEVIAPPSAQPPFRLPDAFNQQAAVGYPIPVSEDGTISLPRLAPMNVKGKTVSQVETMIKDAVTGKKGGLDLVKNPRVTVQMLQKRRYQVTVVREDTVPVSFQTQLNNPVFGGTKKGSGFTISLQAGENDVLHALNATGGPPGLDAKNEVLVFRGQYDPADPATRATRIPLRIYPDQPMTLREEDVILKEGDIVMIEARDTEVYYTAGLLGASQFPLPRDYDLDVIQAIAQVRGPLLNGGFTQNAFVPNSLASGVGAPSPSLVTILRQLPDRRQIPIRVDMNRAFIDPRERVLIQPGDIIVMQERPSEAIVRYFTQAIRFTTVVEALRAGSFTSTGVSNNP